MLPGANKTGDGAMVQIRPAKQRYADIFDVSCSRCGAFGGVQCIEGVTGKARRAPHMARVEAFYESPAARPAARMSRPAAQSPARTAPTMAPIEKMKKPAKLVRKSQSIEATIMPSSSNPVRSMLDSLAAAFGGK
jgi:hypothetical protein